MKYNMGVVKSAKITNFISASLMILAGLLFLLIPDLELPMAQRLILGILFALTGASKILGYFSNDLYRLAFQFDLACGIFCEVLAALILFLPEKVEDLAPLLISIYVILDGLLKVQIALDARRFGMSSWLVILLTALFSGLTGAFALFSSFYDFIRLAAALGIALMVAGLESVYITAYTVRIRVKKKNLSQHYGMEEE